MKPETEFRPMEAGLALEEGKRLPWALIRSYSRVSLGAVPEDCNPEELLEARFFSEEREIRVFRTEDGLSAVSIEQKDGDNTVKERYAVQNPMFGGEITVCHVLAADEDGQTYIAATRLAGWKGEKTNA